MKQLTVKELMDYCLKEIQAGNGDKYIVISDDEEGNGFHGLFYAFSEWEDSYKDYVYESNHNSADDTMILG